MEERKICTHCGTEVEVSDGEYFDGQFYCRACLDELTIVCENCGERIWREDSVEERICQHCYDNHYSRCEGCGELIHNDDANYYNGYVYCDDCYNNRHHEVIEDYDYTTRYSTVKVSRIMVWSLKSTVAASMTAARKILTRLRIRIAHTCISSMTEVWMTV